MKTFYGSDKEIIEFTLEKYETPKITAKKIFDKNYFYFLDKYLFPRKKAINYSILQLQHTIKENPNFPVYKQDYLFDTITELKKMF